MKRTKIFLSAVSSQFKDCRDALASDLRAVGAEVVVQEDFQQHGRSLLEKLEAYIARCDRVIALIGDTYGFEPNEFARPADRLRRSYTQWEYAFAQGERLEGPRQAPKALYVYFASPEFLDKHQVTQDTKIAQLQQQFVSEVRASGKDWGQFGSLHELRAFVLRDGFRLREHGPRSVTKPGLWRHMLDQTLPRFHSLLSRIGSLPEPAELTDLRGYLGDLRSDMEHELRQRIYISLEATSMPSVPPLASEDSEPFIKPVHQPIRQVIGTVKGGDGVSAQISAASRRSKVVRNIVRTLLRSHHPLVLLGDPGTGKTMSLQNAVLAVAAEGEKRVFPVIPIYVRLGDFHVARTRVTPEDVLEYLLNGLDVRIAKRLNALHEAGRLIIFFDGMDEMSRENYSAHIEALSRFASSHQPLTRTLFSCRINDFSPKFLHRRLLLLPFDRRQMREYLSRYITAWPIRVSGESLSLRQLTQRLWAGQLPVDPRNPFVLWLLRFYLLVRQRWPTSRPGLLAFYCRWTYKAKREDAAKRTHEGKDTPVFRALKRPFTDLGRMAYSLTARNLGTSTTLEQLRRDLPDVDIESLLQVGTRCGFLSQTRERGAHRVRFAHHRLQEFFAARHILKARLEIDWLAIFDAPRWQETLVNYVVMGGQPSALEALTNAISERVAAIEALIKEREHKLSEHPKSRTGDGAHQSEIKLPDPAVVKVETSTSEDSIESTLSKEKQQPSAMPEAEETLLADRVDLISRIIRQGTESVRKRLTPPFTHAVRVLTEHGNPSTQVKMMWAAQNVPDADVAVAMIKPLGSTIAWVRNQALMALAEDNVRGRMPGSDLATEMGLDLAKGTLLPRLSAYVKAVVRSGRRGYWASLAVALLCQAGFLVGLLMLAGGAYYAAVHWLPAAQSYAVFRSAWSYATLIGTATVLGLVLAPWALWAFVLGTALATLASVLYGLALWSVHNGWFLGMALAIGFSLLAVLPMLVQFPLIGLYLLLSARIRRTQRTARVFLLSALDYQGYWVALFMAVGLAIGSGLLWLVDRISDWLFSVPADMLFWVGEVSGLPYHPNVNAVFVVMAANLFMWVGLIFWWSRRPRHPSRFKLWSKRVALSITTFTVFSTAHGVSRTEDELTSSLLGWFGPMIVGGSVIAFLLYRFPDAIRKALAIITIINRPYPPGSFTPAQWRAHLEDANPQGQDRILRRTDHQTLGLDPTSFLDLLCQVHSIVQADPALSTYWRMRHELEQVLRQEQ